MNSDALYTGHRCRYKHSAAQKNKRRLSEKEGDDRLELGPSSFFKNRKKSVLIRQCFGKHFPLKHQESIKESKPIRSCKPQINTLTSTSDLSY